MSQLASEGTSQHQKEPNYDWSISGGTYAVDDLTISPLSRSLNSILERDPNRSPFPNYTKSLSQRSKFKYEEIY